MQKVNKKELLIQLGFGIAFYLLIIKNQKKTPTVNVGNVVSEVLSDYQPKYFKNSEYFGEVAPPVSYLNNYKQLVMILDKIRTAFGSAIVITKGYEMPFDGIVRTPFNNCLAVQIYPKNSQYNNLITIIKTLVNTNKISLNRWYEMESHQIYLEI